MDPQKKRKRCSCFLGKERTIEMYEAEKAMKWLLLSWSNAPDRICDLPWGYIVNFNTNLKSPRVCIFYSSIGAVLRF